MEELVSIIVPVYNAAHFIRRCVESLFCQTYSNVELIFVDDCSSDDSIIELRKITLERGMESKVKVLRQHFNQGPGAARKAGVDQARGRMCAFVDSDDWVEPRYIEHLLNAVKCDGDFVVSGVQYSYADSGKSRKKMFNSSINDSENVEPAILSDVINYSYPVGKLFQTEIIRKNNLIAQDISLHEDTAFIMGYLRFAKRIIFIDSCDYHYVFWNEHSLSRRKRKSKELVNISDKLFEAWRLFFQSYAHVRPEDMRNCIQRYGLSQLLQAVLAAYTREDHSFSEAAALVAKVRKRKKEFGWYYRPSSLTIRILLFLILRLPLMMLHPLLKIGVAMRTDVKIS